MPYLTIEVPSCDGEDCTTQGDEVQEYEVVYPDVGRRVFLLCPIHAGPLEAMKSRGSAPVVKRRKKKRSSNIEVVSRADIGDL